MKSTFISSSRKLTACLLILSFLLYSLGFIGIMPARAATVTVDSISALVTAVTNAQAGDTIYLKNGTYNNARNIVLSNSRGTAQNPITIYAQTPGGVTFTGEAGIKLTGKYIKLGGFKFDNVINYTSGMQRAIISMDGASYCTIEHNQFVGCGNDGYGYAIIKVRNTSHHNTIAYNTFDDVLDMSISIVVGSSDLGNKYNHIHHNYFKNIRSSWEINGTYNFLECVQVGQSGTYNNVDMYTTIEYNLTENCVGEQQELYSIKSSSNIIRYNTFRNSYGGLYVRFGNRNTVEGNFLINTKSGIVVIGSDNVVKNNYIEAPYERGIWLSQDPDATTANCTIVNNTIINPEMVSGIELNSEPQNNTIINNFILTSKTPAFTTKGGTATYNKNLVQVSGSGSVGISNPGISTTSNAKITYTGGLWRIGSGSSLINYGQAYSGVTDDMDGQARVGNPDCGADEYSADPVVRSPLMYNQVGASWESKSPLPSPTPIPELVPGGAFIESGGKVCIQAERAAEFTTSAYISNRNSHVWCSTWRKTEGLSGYSVQAWPIGSYLWTDTSTLENESPELTYKVKINSVGNYVLWVLWSAADAAKDGVHVGLDNVYKASKWVDSSFLGQGFKWQNIYTFSNLSEDYHDINFWAREDGLKIDKIYITKAGDTPTGTGPAESVREAVSDPPSDSDYSEDFDDGLAQNWVLNHMEVSGGTLRIPDYEGSFNTGIYNGQTFSGNYTYSVDVYTSAGGTGNIARVFFNYTDDNNHYRLEATSGDSGVNPFVRLVKRLDGNDTTISTYNDYVIKSSTVTFEISYSAGGYITVKATKDGSTTTLFNNVQDSSFTGGKIGVGGRYITVSFDNVEVNASGGSGGDLNIEAESASGQGNFSPFVIGSDAGASGGAYIHAPNNNSTGSVPADGNVYYSFSLSSSGDIEIDARVLAADAASDSFYYRIDDGAWNTWYISNTGSNWQTVTKTIPGLSSGNHTLWIAYREGKLKIDKFTIHGAGSDGDIYSEDFDDGLAQNWVLNHMEVSGGTLRIPDYEGSFNTGIYNGQTFSGNYTYSVDVYTSAGGTGNIARVFFNYTDDNNHYRLEATGGDSGVNPFVRLVKRLDGNDTTISTYNDYVIKSSTVTFEISYSAGGYITVKATKDGSTTTLFNNVQDSSLTSGKIGVGGRYITVSFDNVEVEY